MRTRRAFILLSVMLCSTLAMSVVAANNQGLDWAVEADDTFYYDLTVDGSEGLHLEEEFYLVIENVPSIPDNISDWTEIPSPTMSAYWGNGTPMGFYMYLLVLAYNIVLPTGNWSLLSSLIVDQPGRQDVEVVHDSAEYWGYTYWPDSGLLDVTYYVEVEFLKRSGMLALFNVECWNTTSDTCISFLFSHLQEMPADSSLEPTNQALTWSVFTNNTFDYTLEVIGWEEGTTQEDFYLKVSDDIPLISQSVFRWDQILYPSIDGMWANGTAMGPWMEFLAPAGSMILPTGNWSLITAIAESSLPMYGVEITQDSQYWGYKCYTSVPYVDDYTRVEVKYLKSDGVLAYYEMEVVKSDTTYSYTALHVEVLREGPTATTSTTTTTTTETRSPPAWLQENLLYIGITLGALVGIASIVWLKRR